MIKNLKIEVSKSASAITDLQCRSMRDNLLFTGIEEPELREGEYEDTEKLLCDFLRNEMQIGSQIPFHRVHRVGPYERQFDTPRPIVAKFERFKDREIVRMAAPKTLKGKPYGVREQFPKAVEGKRRLLYPEMKKAKNNKGNKVRLVRDKLFVNNREIVPEQHTEPSHPRSQEQREMQSNQGLERFRDPRSTIHSIEICAVTTTLGITAEVVLSTHVRRGKTSGLYSIRKNRQNQIFRLQRQTSLLNLSVEIETLSAKQPTDSKNIKRLHTLDMDKTCKMHRENLDADQGNNDLETNYIDIDKSPQLTQRLRVAHYLIYLYKLL